MVVKIELHYDVTNAKGTNIPPEAKPLLEKYFKDKLLSSLTLRDKINGETVALTYRLLSKEELIEKIRTGK
jgi:hypothetical protein